MAKFSPDSSDGTYVGTVSAGLQTNMVAFDGSRNLKWSVPRDTPQIATADDGVIGASGTTYDSNGHATGQFVDPNDSWTGNTYQLDGRSIVEPYTKPRLPRDFNNSPPTGRMAGKVQTPQLCEGYSSATAEMTRQPI